MRLPGIALWIEKYRSVCLSPDCMCSIHIVTVEGRSRSVLRSAGAIKRRGGVSCVPGRHFGWRGRGAEGETQGGGAREGSGEGWWLLPHRPGHRGHRTHGGARCCGRAAVPPLSAPGTRGSTDLHRFAHARRSCRRRPPRRHAVQSPAAPPIGPPARPPTRQPCGESLQASRQEDARAAPRNDLPGAAPRPTIPAFREHEGAAEGAEGGRGVGDARATRALWAPLRRS